MASPYIGEIHPWAGNFEPQGFLFCDGRLLAIADYDALFNLIGTTYGGDGQDTFALPDLRGRVPVHLGSGYVQGQVSGQESVTLTTSQMPSHTHAVLASSALGHVADPSAAYPAMDRDFPAYVDDLTGFTQLGNTVSIAGGGQPHENMPPFVAVNYIIAVFGIFPQQN